MHLRARCLVLLGPAALGLASLACAPRPAQAAPGPARRLVLQVESGAPLALPRSAVNQLLDALGPRAALQGDALAELIERFVSRDPGPEAAPDRLALRLSAGRARFIEGEYSAAAVILADLRDELLDRSALLAETPPLRDALYRATLLLALAKQRAGDPTGAAALWSALARGFPDRAPNRAELGPEPVEHFRAALDRLRAAPQGSLTLVGARGQRCPVFLDGRALGTTPLRNTPLPTGSYRLYTRTSEQRGRLTLIDVGTAARQVIVDCERDAVLQTRDGVVALRFATEGEARTEAPIHARSIGAALAVDEVLLVGLRASAAGAMLNGSVVRVRDGALLRRASLTLVATAPASEHQPVNALAHFLLGGEPSPALVGVWRASSARGAGGARRFGAWPWVALAGGLAGLGAGIPLLILDGHGTCSGQPRCPERYDTATPGLILTVGGGLALASAVTLFALRGHAPRDPNAAPTDAAAPGTAPQTGWLRPSVGPWFGRGSAGLTALSRF